MIESDTTHKTTRLLTVVIVLLSLVALFQLGIILQRHLARPDARTITGHAGLTTESAENDIISMHNRINQMFNQAFASTFPPRPTAAVPPPASGGRAVSSFEDPFQAMRQMQHQIDAIFSDVMSGRDRRQGGIDEGWAHLDITPGFKIRDTETAYEITVQLPGVNKSNIRIQMDRSILSLTVEQSLQQSSGTPGDNAYRQSSQTSRFERHLRLPGATNRREDIKATFNQDTLHIVVPKSPQTDLAPHPIPIQ